MQGIFRLEVERLFRRKELYISVIIGILLVIWLAVYETIRLNDVIQLINNAQKEDAAYLFPPSAFNHYVGIDYAALPTTILFAIFPLLSTLPYATTYLEDRNSGYIKNIVIRTSKKKYYLAKFFVTMLSGLVVPISIFLGGFISITMVLPSIMPQMAAFTFPAASNNAMWSDIYRQQPIIYMILYSLLDSLFYAAISAFALGISSFVYQRFVVLVLPSVLFFFSTYALSRFNLWSWIPELFLRQYQPVNVKLNIIIIEIFIIFMVAAILFFFVGDKKDVL